MTALALPTVAASDAQAPARAGRRTHLTTRMGAAFLAIALPLAGLTGLAAWQLTGAAAVAALALGVGGLLATAGTASWLLRGLVRQLRPATQAVIRISSGDLTQAIEVESGGELRPLLEALRDVRERLCTVVGEVRTGTTSVAMNAAQITRDNEALSGRTATQAESLQETAASMEELTAAVRQNAGTAQQAHALARVATERAEQGGQVMREVVETMTSIQGSSRSIGDIIGVIDGIAFQTNILAFNAAVDAARAGDPGRGFAVVAAEVRTLAQRSAAAAREIKGLIGTSVDKVGTGGARVDEAGQAMEEIVAAVRQVAQLIAQIDGASQEQSSGIDNINSAISRIDGTTQDNANFVQGAALTAAALHARAVTLLQAVEVFSLGGREHGNEQEAAALVEQGCAFQRAHGKAALVADVKRLDSGRFIHRDLYLMILTLDDGTFIAHGNNPGRIGTGPKVRDVDGKPFPQEFARVARESGEGWVHYKWVNPVTNEVFPKSAYVRREGDVVVACAVTRF